MPSVGVEMLSFFDLEHRKAARVLHKRSLDSSPSIPFRMEPGPWLNKSIFPRLFFYIFPTS